MKIGDRVYWISQSNGVRTTKWGEIYEIVPTWKIPNKINYPSYLRRQISLSLRRDHESYVVECFTGRRFYWPRVSGLRRVE